MIELYKKRPEIFEINKNVKHDGHLSSLKKMNDILNLREITELGMAKIKLFDPYIDKSEKIAVKRVLDSHIWASGAGTGEVQKFEEEFSKYIDSKRCVALNSGTAASQSSIIHV